MRLLEGNKELNRKYHELPESERLEFLLDGHSQVFSQKQGPFTPMQIPEKIEREQFKELQKTIDNLNFLMARFNMLHDSDYENHVREVCLLRWEYVLALGDSNETHNSQLIADFFEKRGKPEHIKPTFRRMAENAVKYNFLSKKIIEHPAFKKYIDEQEITRYKFRTHLHNLLEDEDYSKEQAAEDLVQEGFDLISCDFNRWYAEEIDFSIAIGKKEYKEKEKDKHWLNEFVAEHAQEKPQAPSLEEVITKQASKETALAVADKEDSGDEPEYEFSKEILESLDKEVKEIIKEKGEETPFWIKTLSPLASDHSKLTIDTSSKVQAKIWDYLWGGDFCKLAYQLKGANPDGRTRNGLNYIQWILFHDDRAQDVNPILAQDAYAMIIAGDILVGDLVGAIRNQELLEEYENKDKLKAAVNLAWETLQHPGISDDEEGYEPPRSYCYKIAKEFKEFLTETPSAQPYFNLINADKIQLGGEEHKILESVSDLETIEKIYTQVGQADSIKEKYLNIFDAVFDTATEFSFFFADIRGIISLVQNPTFRKHVDDKAIGERLNKAVQRTESKKLVIAKLHQSPALKPYLSNRDIGAMVEGMIDVIVGGNHNHILTEPLSLRNQYEIEIGGMGRILEAYMIADSCRDKVNPEKIQDLVAYMLAIGSDMTVGSGFGLVSSILNTISGQEDSDYQIPEYFPEASEEDKEEFVFLSNIYKREKELDGLNMKKASTAVTNVIFRGNYAQPGRFYPHIDSMLDFLDTPLAELLPEEGLGADSIKEYKILHEFVRN